MKKKIIEIKKPKELVKKDHIRLEIGDIFVSKYKNTLDEYFCFEFIRVFQDKFLFYCLDNDESIITSMKLSKKIKCKNEILKDDLGFFLSLQLDFFEIDRILKKIPYQKI